VGRLGAGCIESKAMTIRRLRFLVEAVGIHPKACYALGDEVEAAKDLVELGLMADVDETDPGCFALTSKGERMIQFLDEQLLVQSRLWTD